MSAQLSFLESAVRPSGPRPLLVGARVWARRGYLANKGPLEPGEVIEFVPGARVTIRFDRGGYVIDTVACLYGPGRWLDREPTAEEQGK